MTKQTEATPRTWLLALIREHEYSIREYETHAPGFRAQTEREMNETREHILDFVERELTALRAECDAMREALENELKIQEAALDEWNKQFPRLPWREDQPAMQQISRFRAALAAAESAKEKGNG